MPSDVTKRILACLAAAATVSTVAAQQTETVSSEDAPEPAAEILPLNEDDAPAPPAADEEAVEEIIVVAPRPGGRRRIEFDDPERARLLRELYASREDQEELARMAAIADEQDRRIRLGYNPELERPPDLGERMAIPQNETTQPATIFTIQW